MFVFIGHLSAAIATARLVRSIRSTRSSMPSLNAPGCSPEYGERSARDRNQYDVRQRGRSAHLQTAMARPTTGSSAYVMVRMFYCRK